MILQQKSWFRIVQTLCNLQSKATRLNAFNEISPQFNFHHFILGTWMLLCCVCGQVNHNSTMDQQFTKYWCQSCYILWAVSILCYCLKLIQHIQIEVRLHSIFISFNWKDRKVESWKVNPRVRHCMFPKIFHWDSYCRP